MSTGASTLPMLIDGRPAAALGEPLAVVNPATEKVIAHVPNATDDQLDEAVTAAVNAFESWSRVGVDDRCSVVREIGTRIAAHAEDLAVLLTQEQGKPLSDARAEVARAAQWCEALAGLEVPWEVDVRSAGRLMTTRRVPLGVVAAIVPWNFPVTLAVWKIAPALLAGNTVVVKPSPFTPLTALRLAELIVDLVPAGVVNVVTGDDSLGPRLTADQRIAKIAFTGSTATGKTVLRASADRLTRVTLELGGNDPAIVLPDVDVAEIAPKIFWACFRNSGQYCLAAKRVYIHDDVYDALGDQVVNYAKTVTVGNGLDPLVGLGPIQNRIQFEKVRALVESCRAEGMRFLLEPEVGTDPGYFMTPGIVDGPPDGSAIVTEEPFGPIVPFLRYTDIDDVVARANDTRYGLGGSVWGRDLDQALDVARRLESGWVWVNEIHRIDPMYPFGGLKESGMGIENGVDGILQYTGTTVISADLTAST